MSRFESLGKALRTMEPLPRGRALYMRSRPPWDVDTPCALLQRDVYSDELPPFAAEHGLMRILSASEVLQVIENARQQVVSVGESELVRALAYYYEHDAFMELSGLKGVVVQWDDLIRRARAVVARDAAHDLPLWLRHQIWMAMGEGRRSGVGYLRRVELASRSARYVLPIWDARYPDDRLPHRMLATMEAYRRSELSAAEAKRLSLAAWERLVELSSDASEVPTACAGFSAVQAVRVAIYDELVLGKIQGESTLDTDVDAEDTDAALFASAAYAGGVAWDGRGDPGRRREFWEWWLATAVPEAFSCHPG